MKTGVSENNAEVVAAPNRLVKAFAMLLLPLLVAAVVACDNTGASERAPYEGTIEGKPPGLGAPVPDPKETLETLPAGQMPEFIVKMEGKDRERAETVYKGAVDNYEAYQSMPCYCGCAIYTTAHKSLAQCFIKEKKADGSLVFTDHSMTCSLCQEGAQMTIAGVQSNRSLPDIRTEMFNKLKYTGIWTDTPPIPQQ